MRTAPDTNVLIYAEGLDDLVKQAAAKAVLRSLSEGELVIPVQVLGEFYSVLLRKGRMSPADAQTRVQAWSAACSVIDTTEAILNDAMELVARHQFGSWDAVIIAAAASADCRVILSEDMQDGFTWRGVTLRNPFAG